jgi:hypothetical protein
VRSIVSIFLLVLMIGSGTGFWQRLHALQHEREDSAAVVLTAGGDVPHPAPVPHKHSDDGCPICVQLHAPMISTNFAAWLIDTGEWVRYVSMLPESQRSQVFVSRLTCRGPPSVSC